MLRRVLSASVRCPPAIPYFTSRESFLKSNTVRSVTTIQGRWQRTPFTTTLKSLLPSRSLAFSRALHSNRPTLNQNLQEDAQFATLPILPSPAVGRWLLLSSILVLGVIVVGGVTRLTESGLSITEWRPVTGILPPLSHAEWMVEFDKYKETPEFKM
jgi:cytochrome c oxidase assembly protein subunit 15